MSRASPHQFTTLDGTDMSKVRDCITESKSTALDVRILKVAEWLASVANVSDAGYHPSSASLRDKAEALREIAAELRDAATAKHHTITHGAILASFAECRTERDLSDAWRDAAPSLPSLPDRQRIAALEAWITRMCVVSEDDGR
jgi:hypothetical protein